VNVRWIDPDASIGAGRGQVVVCIPVYGGHEHFVSCLQSVLAHTPADVPILICDDASPDPRSQELVRSLEREDGSPHDLFYLRRKGNVGFPANANGAFAIAAPADVLVLNSDCVVAEGWLEGLRDAAYCDSRVATATALTNNGSLASVPERRPIPGLPQGWSLDEAAAAVRSRSLRIRPRLPSAIGHCVLIRRSALDLVGEFDLAFSPGYGEEVDFSQRCLSTGLCHVLADDVFVLHHGGGSFSADGKPNPVQQEHERILAARYPYYHSAVVSLEEDPTAPLARARSAARRALSGLSVLVDARILTGPMTGTQLQVLEVIAALARAEKARIGVIVPSDLSDYARRALDGLPRVKLITRGEGPPLARDPADVVHRPFQVGNDEDLTFLASVGERLVITHQDLISYHNPSYHKDFSAWRRFRRVTRSALAVADHVVFVSGHARDDALAEGLIDPARASVVHNGVDHTLPDARREPTPPREAAGVPEGAEVILCIGTDFRHKNRLFALRILEQLQRRHDWRGYLLLVGPRVDWGSSVPGETEFLSARPRVAQAVVDLRAVSEPEKAWLFARAGLVLYPTVHEGFGLVPFEATDHGVPCMWAAGTSLSEVLPEHAAEIVAWDAAATADRALRLLREERAREDLLATVRSAATGRTWDAAAERLLELYEATCDAPAAPTTGLERGQGLLQGLLSEDAMRLVGPGGALPQEVERPLLAIATHRQVGAPMFRAIRLGYRASFRLRRLGRGGRARGGNNR
jgi:GT2 family glycosyltransferase